MRERIDEIGKPLAALVITHAHPDHYGGAVEAVGDSGAPTIATAGVDAIIRRDDPIKEEILRPMFGDEWPAQRAFPTQIVQNGSELSYGDIKILQAAGISADQLDDRRRHVRAPRVRSEATQGATTNPTAGLWGRI